MTDTQIWAIILLLGCGTYLIRFSFLGLIGDRPLPPFVLRLLKYVGVAILPGLVAPLVIWPAAAGGDLEPVRLSAALAALVAGALSRQILPSILAGFVVLFGLPVLLS